MYNFNNRKNQKLITAIVLIVVVAMVVTTLVSAFVVQYSFLKNQTIMLKYEARCGYA